jgi:hypothetical protein
MKIWILKTNFLLKKPYYYRKPTKKNPCIPWLNKWKNPLKTPPIITENPIVYEPMFSCQ